MDYDTWSACTPEEAEALAAGMYDAERADATRESCPVCGEDRNGKVIWDFDGWLHCKTCGTGYDPTEEVSP